MQRKKHYRRIVQYMLLLFFVMLLCAGLSGCGSEEVYERPAKPDTPAGEIVNSITVSPA